MFCAFSQEESVGSRLENLRINLQRSRENIMGYDDIKKDIFKKIHDMKLALKFNKTFQKIEEIENQTTDSHKQ